MGDTHYFLAIPLPEEIRTFIIRKRDEWKEGGVIPFKSWVHPEDYHITLAFLGHAAPKQLEGIKKNMPEIIHRHQNFSLRLTFPGVFGRSDSPRIFWYGLDREERLNSLQKDVFEECVKLGFQLDSRPYSPHITLARRWSGSGAFQKEKLTSQEEAPPAFTVSRAVLYQTHLDRSPKYETIMNFPLS